MTGHVEQVFTKILIDFINEHDEIGYDIISELNKFDQYIMGRRHAVLPNSEQAVEPAVNMQYLAETNMDRIFMEYADYSWNQCDQPTYSCKLCGTADVQQQQQQFTTLDQFLMHIQKCHATNIVDEQNQHNLDRQCAKLWVDELEKLKKLKYKKHNDEFMNEIDEILGAEDYDVNDILNSLDVHDNNSGIVFNANDTMTLTDLLAAAASTNGTGSSTRSKATLSAASSSPTGSERKPAKKKKKRTSGQCDVCNRTFNDLYNLRIHKMIHTGEKPFQCEECGKRFRQYNKLKIHCITHTDKKPYICDICEKGFRFRNYLSVHKRLHSGENPYKCKFCDEYFHSLHSRRLHTKMMHCEAKTYACPICDKVLTAQCYLTAHIKRHTNQRDYKCETCGKCFFSQSQLKDHQLVHTNLKPYQCTVCYARFQRKSNYTQHLKIHTGQKTYLCHICYKSFAQNAGLYGHMKSHAKCL